MDDDIRRRLFAAENDFLAAVSDPPTMHLFSQQWSTLLHDFDLAIHDLSLSKETAFLGHATASRVQILADHLIQFEDKFQEVSSSFEAELEEIFSEISLTDGSSISLPLDLSHSVDPCAVHKLGIPDTTNYPPYIAPAYKWLLRNLHDPYPSSDVKWAIAHSCGSSVKAISAWFTSVRKRIGWTAISRKYYYNCRADTVDAAYRCLVEDDGQNCVDSRTAYDFMEMKAVAGSLYSAQFKKSHLAGKLDIMVKDMVDEDRLQLQRKKVEATEIEKWRKRAEKDQSKARRSQEKETRRAPKSSQARFSYPSPTRSSYSSPEPFTTSQEEESNSEGVNIATGHKRRVSLNGSDFILEERSAKRHRTTEVSLEETIGDGSGSLPSPQSPSVLLLQVHDPHPSPIELLSLQSSTPDPAPAISRKRRLSDTAIQGIPKHPCGIFTGPRVQAVSDPLPLNDVNQASELDSWLQINLNFDVPAAVTAGDLDFSAPLDVHFFDDWDTCQNSPIETPSQHITLETISPLPEQIEIPDHELHLMMSFPPMGANINLSETLDDLFSKSIPPISQACQPLSVSEPTSFSTSSFSSADIGHDGWADFASCLFSDGATSYDLPQPQDSSNLPPKSHPFDSSVFALSTPSPAQILAQADEANRLAERNAKLEQLRAHREAARKLEEELLSVV